MTPNNDKLANWSLLTSVGVDLSAVGAEGERLDAVVHLDGERLLLRPRAQEVHVAEPTLMLGELFLTIS